MKLHTRAWSLLVLMTLAMGTGVIFADQAEKPGPTAVALETIKDFGVVNKGQRVTHEFQIRNAGEAELEITEVRPSCGCTVAEFDKLRAQENPPVVIDVRGVGEWETRSVEGNLNLPLQELLQHLDEVPRDQPLVLYCKGGYRSAIAASILQRAGIDNVIDVLGGFDAWAEAHPVESASA